MSILGMDVSYYQGNIDWLRIKNSRVKFAILKIGYTGYGIKKKKILDRCLKYIIKMQKQ